MNNNKQASKPIPQMENRAYRRKDDEDFDTWARRSLTENPSMYFDAQFISYAVDLEHSEHKEHRDAFAKLSKWVKASGSFRINKFNKLVKLENAERRKLQVKKMRANSRDNSKWADVFTEDGIEINPELSSPPDSTVTQSGVFRTSYKEKTDGTVEQSDTLIAADPVLVTDSIQSVDDGVAYIELTYRYRDSWDTMRCPRERIADKNQIKRYAGRGLPVGSHNAEDLSRFILDAEKHNEDHYDGTHCTRYIGWSADDSGFLLDGRFITEPENKKRLIYVPSEEESADLWRALHRHGDLEAWQKMAKRIIDHPKAYICLVASLSAPLLKMLGLKNYLIDLAGESGGGKTTAVCFAGSVWGYCPPQASGNTASMKRSWNATIAGSERFLSSVRGVASIFDETKLANKIEDVSRIAYMVGNGTGRQRATATGMQASTAFNTVLLSTGEDRLVDLAGKHEGVRRRTIQLDALPFGTTRQAVLVKDIEECTSEHYGHAGVAFIERLVCDMTERKNWRAWMDERAADYLKQASGMDARRGVASSLADVAACIDLAGELAHAYGVLPGSEYQSPVAECMGGIYEMATTADQTKQAMCEILETVASNQLRMRRSDEDENATHPPSQGYIGVYAQVKGVHCAAVGARWCKEELESMGYIPETIIREWVRREWLVCGSGQTSAQAEIGKGENARVIAIRRTVIDELTADIG